MAAKNTSSSTETTLADTTLASTTPAKKMKVRREQPALHAVIIERMSKAVLSRKMTKEHLAEIAQHTDRLKQFLA